MDYISPAILRAYKLGVKSVSKCVSDPARPGPGAGVQRSLLPPCPRISNSSVSWVSTSWSLCPHVFFCPPSCLQVPAKTLSPWQGVRTAWGNPDTGPGTGGTREKCYGSSGTGHLDSVSASTEGSRGKCFWIQRRCSMPLVSRVRYLEYGL